MTENETGDQSRQRFRVAVDVGGTFIDLVLLDEQTGAVKVEKVQSLAEKLPEQFLLGLQKLEPDLEKVGRIFHGMTVAVNALIQERGARVGLLTTKGFRDVLEMGRGGRKPVYNFVHAAPRPIVEREMRREIDERASYKGEIIRPINLDDVDREVDFLVSEGAEAIAIAFLHSYSAPEHELAAAKRVRERFPDLPISLSHDVAAEWREFERTSTTVLNSFVQPRVKGYLENLEATLGAASYHEPLAIMQSNGGVASVEAAGRKPIRTLMSGPAGGVIGAKFLCSRLGYDNVICTDVGGTSYDVALIEDGKILERNATEIANRPILGSLIDVISVGAGGGSIAWLDHRNGLQVGPQSAGASPGPVCFGLGGIEPTTTDAQLVVGRLDPKFFLGGRMQLDLEGARRAIDEKIAKPLSLSVEDAAHGIIALAETNMANAIRQKTVQRGLDVREFVKLAYGGGGGLFACAVAEELDIPKVIIPPASANFSAWGILTSDYVEDEVRTKMLPFDEKHIDQTMRLLGELSERAIGTIEAYGFPRSKITVLKQLDMRFENQEFTLTIDHDQAWDTPAQVLEGMRERFVASHLRLYGHGDPSAPLEQVSVRCRAIGAVQPPKVSAEKNAGASAAAKTRIVNFAGIGDIETPVYERASLPLGDEVVGPAIIEEWTTTIVILPNWRCKQDEYGNILIERQMETRS